MADAAAKRPSCPICKRPADAHYRPFCSRRCADVDLARWLGGVYAIPVENADDDEDGDPLGPLEAAPEDRRTNGRH